MNEEEKQAYNYLEKYIEWETLGERNLEGDIKTILNLIDKQQKEIEDLKTLTREYEAYECGEGDKIVIASKEWFVEGFFKDFLSDYISKDKIKEKIEELEKPTQEGQCLNVIQGYVREGNLILLKELLGE